MQHFKTLAEIAAQLGCSKSTLTRMRAAHEDWFPAKGLEGYSLQDVQRAIADNHRAGGLKRACSQALTGADPASLRQAVDPNDPDLVELRKTDDPVEISRVTVRILKRELAYAVENQAPTSGTVTSLKNALSELRRNEESQLALDVQRGNLIQIETAQAAVGSVIQRLVVLHKKFISEIPTKFEVLLADPVFTKLPYAERRRGLRAWAEDLSRTLRDAEAKEVIEQFLEQEGA